MMRSWSSSNLICIQAHVIMIKKVCSGQFAELLHCICIACTCRIYGWFPTLCPALLLFRFWSRKLLTTSGIFLAQYLACQERVGQVELRGVVALPPHHHFTCNIVEKYYFKVCLSELKQNGTHEKIPFSGIVFRIPFHMVCSVLLRVFSF